MQVVPRVYQKAATRAAVKGLRGRQKRALVVLATGLGKTLTAAFITKQFRARRILFLVHNNFILKHAADEFRLVFDIRTKMATYNGMSKEGAAQAHIVFSTWQTMGKSLEQWARNCFDLIVVDEAHHSEADTYKPVLKYFTGPKLGVTATPDREDESDIREVFGHEVINVTLEEAIARGWLPRIEYHVITDESLDEDTLQKIAAEIREGKRRFTMAEVNRRIFIKKRDVEVARVINGYNEKALVFCQSITHANRMSKSLDLASTFHSQKGSGQKDTWDKNQTTLDALKNGIVRRVCAVNAFNEGVNVPSIGLVAFCRVTGVLTVFRQQLGRGLRPGKEKLIVLDFVGNLERIQLVLKMMNKISDLHEQCTPKDEIAREGYVRERFEVSGKGFEFTFSDEVVDLMKILEHCEQEFYPTWQEASVTTRRLGIKTKEEYRLRYKEDLRLCSLSNLDYCYTDFPGLTVFLGGQIKDFYPTWQAASKSAKKLGARNKKEYALRYKEDSKLHSNPDRYYADFPGWCTFLDKYYLTWQDASKVAQQLGIKSHKEYLRRYKEDVKLNIRPDQHHTNFPGWDVFLGNKPKNLYPTWKEAFAAIVSLRLTSSNLAREYKLRYKEDPRLPAELSRSYSDFPGWAKFRGKSR